MLRQGIKDRNSVLQSLTHIHIIMTGLSSTGIPHVNEIAGATSTSEITDSPPKYQASGRLPYRTEQSLVVEHILTRLRKGMKEVRTRSPSRAETERWLTCQWIIDEMLQPSDNSLHYGVSSEVRTAVDKENSCPEETKTSNADGSLSTTMRGEHPFEWMVEVSIDEQGDPQASYGIAKGWKRYGRIDVTTIRPHMYHHLLGVTIVDSLSKGWENNWTEEGRQKSSEQLQREQKEWESKEAMSLQTTTEPEPEQASSEEDYDDRSDDDP